MDTITEMRPVTGPVVYGFLRLPAVNPARWKALAAVLRVYCERHELELAAVFSDQGDSVLSAAFAGLVDVLELDGTYGVVAPSLAHLGNRRIGRQRQERIAASGRRLILVRPGHLTTMRPEPAASVCPWGDRY